MTLYTRQHESEQTFVFGSVQDASRIKSCCRETVDLHAENNPMMVCSGCKQIIKCFTREQDFKNYCTFCGSRRREIEVGRYADRYVVTFHSYGS